MTTLRVVLAFALVFTGLGCQPQLADENCGLPFELIDGTYDLDQNGADFTVLDIPTDATEVTLTATDGAFLLLSYLSDGTSVSRSFALIANKVDE